ncbi:hypothetical protein [Candidatus Pantoea soli]|uniref:hypothetical protein n=1 Tax=Candidatus Pantoea soli TaxID=3098669 RepID=UPI0011A6A941|nr:hypothetical protein [Pantoea soli]
MANADSGSNPAAAYEERPLSATAETHKKEGRYCYQPVKEECVYDFGYRQHRWRGAIFAQSSDFRQHYSSVCT